MKKSNCALGLMALLTAAVGLSACDTPTKDNSGNIFTYTDAAGKVYGYTANNLYDSYQSSGSTLSTEFDKVYEVLVRHYYDDASNATAKAALEKTARKDVETDKTSATDNAKNNKTSFQVEFEKILTSHSVKNVDELYEYYLYTEEKTKFEETFYSKYIDAMKDGAISSDSTVDPLSIDDNDKLFLPGSTDTYGIGNAGWLKDQMPYVIRHILVKVAATDKEYTQGTLTEDKGSGTDKVQQATRLATVVARLAGATLSVADDTAKTATVATDTNRKNFGDLAKDWSDDTGSASAYGETSLMTKVMSSDLVPEFKLGIYAFESMFNKRETATTYGAKNSYRIHPGLKETATAATDVDETLKLEDGSKLADSSVYGETHDDGTNNIGTIPFGAAVALMRAASVETDSSNSPVYESLASFFPRNIIFNKYFNKRNVCVITPNDIDYNSASASTSYTKETFDGTYSSTFGALPGFQVTTTDVLPQFTHNVLTDSEGQIILVARAGTSSYQGVHFMVVQRDALSQYGLKYDETAKTVVENTAAVDGTATLSQYYTTKNPDLTGYPTDSKGNPLVTYVNYNRNNTSDYNDRSGAIVSAVKTYNGAFSTYLFEKLVNGLDGVGKLDFQDKTFEATMMNYCKQKRQSTLDDTFNSWNTNWKSYAEMLQAQNEARANRDAKGNGRLISEVCAIGYTKTAAERAVLPEWQQGGACYYVKG